MSPAFYILSFFYSTKGNILFELPPIIPAFNAIVLLLFIYVSSYVAELSYWLSMNYLSVSILSWSIVLFFFFFNLLVVVELIKYFFAIRCKLYFK